MRLIDADRFKRFLQALCNAGAPYDEVIKLLNQEPTVYDVDKVVEEMKANSKKMSETKFPHTYYKAIGTRKCEEIIRGGFIC